MIMASTVSWKSTDGGKTWTVVQGRARRRGLPERLDQSRQPRHHPARRRSGRGRHAQRRRHLELLVQPADRRSSTTWRPTTRFPTASAAGSRRTARCASRAAATTARSRIATGCPVGVDEYGFVAPDPLNPDIVYGGRTVTRFDRRTGQVSVVGPVGGRGGVGGATGTFRQVRTMPVVFSEVDKRALFFANNHLWKTIDGGAHWKQHEPRPDAPDVDRAGERRQVPRAIRRRSPRRAASSTPSRRRTRTSTASGSGPTTG